MFLHNWAFEHYMAMYSELSPAIRWWERLSRGKYCENITVLISNVLTPTAMVNNVAEKFNKCPLYHGR